ncbi:MAG: FAD-dependent oxidoreductase [Thermoleophilia bacterium]
MTTTPVAAGPSRMLYVDDLMLRPADGGRLLLHCDAHDRRVAWDEPTDPPPAPAGDLLDLARRRVPAAVAAQVDEARIGLRALTADYLPALGWLADGLYLAVTHSGVTLAAALGSLIADEVLEGHASEPLAPFRPQRLLTPGA